MRCFEASRRFALTGSAPGLVLVAPAPAQQSAHPWLNPRLAPDQRAAMVEKAMTPDKRVSMLRGPMALPFGAPPPAEALADGSR